MTESQLPKSLEEAVEQIVRGLNEEFRKKLLNSPKSEIHAYHDGWGTGIRNELGLHGSNPRLLKDCGSETMHFDDASAVIMNAVWNHLHGIPVGDARIGNYRFWADRVRDSGVDKLYRRSRLRRDGKPEKKQTVYRRLKMFFPMNNYKEFCQLSERIDAEDKLAEQGAADQLPARRVEI